MKRLLFALVACLPAFAQGTVQQAVSQIGANGPSFVDVLTWTADPATGSIPATILNTGQFPIIQGYRVISVETKPGTPAPTNGYSLTLTDVSGADLLGGAGTGLSSTASQSFGTAPGAPPIFGTVTMIISGQSVASAKGTVYVYFSPITQSLGLTAATPTFPAQGADLFLASPCGSTGSPGFRALCVADFNNGTAAGAGTWWNGTGAWTAPTWTQIQGTKQGNTNVPQMAGTNSGVAGAGLCDDASGNATTSGCTPPFPSGTQTQILHIKPNTGNNTTTEFASLLTVHATDYNFPAQSPTGALSASVPATATLTPCPNGVNGSDSNHWLYVAGTGTPEPVLITGGTCSSGGSTGTVTFTPANSHAGGWTIASAQGGIEEATIAATAAGGGIVALSAGTISAHAQIYLNSSVCLVGEGVNSIISVPNGEFANLAQWYWSGTGNVAIVYGTSVNQACIKDLQIDMNGSAQTYSGIGNGTSAVIVLNNSSNNVISGVTLNHVSAAAPSNGAFLGLSLRGTSNNNQILRNILLAVSCNTSNFGAQGFVVQTNGTNNRFDGNYMSNGCAGAFGSGTGSAGNVFTNNTFELKTSTMVAGAQAFFADNAYGTTFIGNTCIGNSTGPACFTAVTDAGSPANLATTFVGNVGINCGQGYQIEGNAANVGDTSISGGSVDTCATPISISGMNFGLSVQGAYGLLAGHGDNTRFVILSLGANQNVNTADYGIMRIQGVAGAFSIGGLTGGFEGRHLDIFNDAAVTMTLTNQDAGSTAANRICTLTGSDVALNTNRKSWASLVYSGLDTCWVLTNYNNY